VLVRVGQEVQEVPRGVGHDPAEPVRIDKWLWAARLAKTRALASEAAGGGRVSVNGQRVKPSRPVRPGDEVEVSSGEFRRIVVVLATAQRRVSAAEAALLYVETDESIEARERRAAELRLTRTPVPDRGTRPTKRDRRRYEADERRRRG